MTQASRDTVGSPDYSVIDSKVYESKIISTYQILWHPDCSCCGDRVNRVASQPRLRRGQARWRIVFCSPSGLFHHDPKLTSVTRTLYRQDSFIVTSKCTSTYRDWQKMRHCDPSLTLWAGSDGT